MHGIKRRSSSFNTARVDHLYQDPHGSGVRFFLHYGDMTDSTNLIRIIQEVQPTEIYNLAAQSHVRVSFETPEYTANADALGTLRLLEAIRILRLEDKVRFYQASTSELYGKAQEVPQRETTPFYPRSPYAAAKLYAYWITVNYREAYGMHASNGILFNHEGPTRGETFVTRKITRAVAGDRARPAAKAVPRQSLRPARLGPRSRLRRRHVADLAAARARRLRAGDRGRAFGPRIRREGVRAYRPEHRMARRGRDEQGIDTRDGRVLIEIDPRYFRPTEVETLLGDPSKARQKLGWHHKVSFEPIGARDGRCRSGRDAARRRAAQRA